MNNSQELANLIKSLLKQKGKSVGEMLKACGLSVNALSSMQSGGYFPRAEALCKIADYLDCSVDYLLGRTDNPEAHK
jgi:transcriptional regulator with XRE-family HTH domain